MRFRKNAVAITSDVEQMFYQFRVTENHRDYMWYTPKRGRYQHSPGMSLGAISAAPLFKTLSMNVMK
jgi:hypothetical protein